MIFVNLLNSILTKDVLNTTLHIHCTALQLHFHYIVLQFHVHCIVLHLNYEQVVGAVIGWHDGKSQLEIARATKSDEGTYTCLAENTAGHRKAVAGVRIKGKNIIKF